MTPTIMANVRRSRCFRQIPHALRDVGADARAAARTLWSERARDRHQRDGGDEVARGAAGEREGDRDTGEDATDGRADELVHRQLGGVEAPVGPAEIVDRDDGGHDRLRRCVEQGLADPQHERHDVEQPESLVLVAVTRGETADEDGAGRVDAHHRRPAVEPVGQRPRMQREHEPRQPRNNATAAMDVGRLRQPKGEQGERHLEDAVGQVGQGRRAPQLPVVRSEGCWQASATAAKCSVVIEKSQSVRMFPMATRPRAKFAKKKRREATPDEFKAMAHPLRLRILRLCLHDAMTNKELAERLGKDPASVLHHVRMLVGSGFLEAEPVRAGRGGALEKPYRATGKSWILSMEKYPADKRFAADLAVIDAFRDEVLAEGADEPLWFARLGLKLNEASIEELRVRVDAILQEFAARSEDTDGDRYGIFLGIHRRT